MQLSIRLREDLKPRRMRCCGRTESQLNRRSALLPNRPPASLQHQYLL
jgi:hypothetical protein